MIDKCTSGSAHSPCIEITLTMPANLFKTFLISGLSSYRRSEASKEDDAIRRVIHRIRSTVVIHRCQVEWTHRQKLPTCTNIYQGVPVSTATTTTTDGPHRNKGATSDIRNERCNNQDLNASTTERKRRKWRKYEMCFSTSRKKWLLCWMKKLVLTHSSFFFTVKENKFYISTTKKITQCNE